MRGGNISESNAATGPYVAPARAASSRVALTTIAAIQGVWGVRVHEVRGSLDAIKVVQRWLSADVPAGQTAFSGRGQDGRTDRPGPAGSVEAP